jgi:hypothetical protein
MKPHPKIQTLGYQAYKMGIPKTKNPFQYHSLKNQGPQKAAAWNTGWEKAKMRAKSGTI